MEPRVRLARGPSLGQDGAVGSICPARKPRAPPGREFRVHEGPVLLRFLREWEEEVRNSMEITVAPGWPSARPPGRRDSWDQG